MNDGAENRVLATVSVGTWPYKLLYNVENNKVYCTNLDDNNVMVIDGRTNQVLVTIEVGQGPGDLCHNPLQNRVYVENCNNHSISVLRDSMSGVEESHKPQASSYKCAATVVRTLPSGAVAFDAMGRRVLDPKPGVYFLRPASGVMREASSITKVIVQR